MKIDKDDIYLTTKLAYRLGLTLKTLCEAMTDPHGYAIREEDKVAFGEGAIEDIEEPYIRFHFDICYSTDIEIYFSALEDGKALLVGCYLLGCIKQVLPVDFKVYCGFMNDDGQVIRINYVYPKDR